MQTALTCQKLFEADRYITVSIIVIPLEHIRHSTQANARLDEQIKAHTQLSRSHHRG